MQTPNELPSIGDDTPPSFDPQVTEEMMDEYRRDEWESGEPCPECGSEDVETKSLNLEEMEEHSIGPNPAYADCNACGEVLYRHPKWVVFEIVGDDYAYCSVN